MSWVLILTSLVQNVGPVTTRTTYPDLATCETNMRQQIAKISERMIHAECKPIESH